MTSQSTDKQPHKQPHTQTEDQAASQESTKKSGRDVPFFRYSALIKQNEGEVRARIEDVLSRGAFIFQKDLFEFEKNLAKFMGVKHAIGVANGTDGLIIALKVAGIREGDEVILPSHTFVATASSVKMTGGVPVLVDCREDHLIDPALIEKAITKKTRFIMPVQLNGRTADMDKICEIANKHKLEIIEDSAQALGSKFKEKSAGTFGKAGMISFYPAKVLGCFGDGGAIVTNDTEMFEKMTLMREHGRDPKSGQVVSWGMNSRLDNMQAAILDVQLKHYPEVMKRRRAIASLYQEGLSSLSQVHLPPAPTANGDHFDIFQNYEAEFENRDELKTFLAARGIGSLVQWGGSAIHQFKALGFNQRLPITERVMAKSLMLPINMFVSDEDIQFVIDSVRHFYSSKSK